MSDPQIPAGYEDLLQRPLYASMATVRPDGAPQSNVMWYEWTGEVLRLTHTKHRQKYRNLQHEPRVSLSIADPDDPLRFLEVRGVVESIDDDDDRASFYKSLQHRYGEDYEVTDGDVRVVVTIRPTRYVAVTGGSVQH
jgi:PPOX class probable F420-dependent enzyme